MESLPGDDAVAWRLAAAARINQAYAENPRLAALTVAGSTGSGRADRWSDLEIDCYWSVAPLDEDRRAPIERLGAELEAFWDYDDDDHEWSEDYQLGSLPVTISNYTVATVDLFLDAVTVQADTDPVKHMRLSAIRRCRPLRGANLVIQWRRRADEFPDRLAAALITQILTPQLLAGWSAREALAERGDTVAGRALLSGIEQAIVSSLLAVNHIYRPHRVLKWQASLLAELRIAPDDLEARLAAMWRAPMTQALSEAEQLLTQTMQLVTGHTPAQIDDFRDTLAERRRPVGSA